MALDGSMLHIIKNNLNQSAVGSRVDKIFMPYKDMVILQLSSRDFSGRLLISCNPNSPRIHITNEKYENPATPPMLCMLLRKRLAGGRLNKITQAGLDRVLFLDFDCKNELGDEVVIRVAVEIMGRSSNIIFLQDGKIIDAVRRVDPEAGTRFILPGATYELPTPQDKINILENESAAVTERLKNGKNDKLDKALMSVIDGVSPIVCRELQTLSCRSNDCLAHEMTSDQIDRLKFFIGELKEKILKGGTPTLVSDKSGKPLDFTFINITQYGMSAVTKEFSDYGTLLDAFYTERENSDRIKHQSQSLLKLLTNLSERQIRKINARKAELKNTEDREQLRIFGELIKANLHSIKSGDSCVESVNYYDPDCCVVRIPLDVALSPSKNAQKYFKDYKKATTAAQMLNDLILSAQEELKYIDSVFDALTRAKSAAEIAEIKQELKEAGYIKTNEQKKRNTVKLTPLKFKSDDGFNIFVGRNNYQNDQLTLKTAAKNDIWLHTKNIPGSHVIIEAGGDVPDSTIEQAAIIAAYHSKAAGSSMVPVDYTYVKNVKKPSGAKPGMVIYVNNKTAYVNPDEDLVNRLKI